MTPLGYFQFWATLCNIGEWLFQKTVVYDREPSLYREKIPTWSNTMVSYQDQELVWICTECQYTIILSNWQPIMRTLLVQ